jgi:hypothetical protein
MRVRKNPIRSEHVQTFWTFIVALSLVVAAVIQFSIGKGDSQLTRQPAALQSPASRALQPTHLR